MTPIEDEIEAGPLLCTPAAPGWPWPIALLLALLVALLYGRHLGEGLLSDDFLYARWALKGWGVLLRHVTVASDPRMIRPLPGLLWMLSRWPAGPGLLHAFSLLLHLANGVLLATLVRRLRRATGRGGAALEGLAVAALFIAFPLHPEPVIWASASFDLWACCFALAATLVAFSGEGRGRATAASGLFLLALLSKESVLTLPLLLPLLIPGPRLRRPALGMAGVAAVYLIVRLALFGGLGGYRAADRSSALGSLQILPTLHSFFLRLPLRLLVPVKRPGELAMLFGLLSVLLLGAILGPWLSGLRGKALLTPLRIAAACGLALLPVAPILSLNPDQEGSRMLYFPAAIAFAGLGILVTRLPRASHLAMGALLLFWGAATLWNGRAWTAAAAEVGRTRATLAAFAPRFPHGSEIVVAGHDTWEGAFAWRNGLAAAAEVDRLAGSHLWTLGTAAAVENPGPRLGRDLFELELDRRGEWVDSTACARALLAPPVRRLASWPLTPALDPTAGATFEAVLPSAPLAPPTRDLEVRLQLGSCRPASPLSGRLFWLFADSRKFQSTSSLPFVIGPRTPAEVVLRLFPEARPEERITLLVDLPRALVPCVVGAQVAAVPSDGFCIAD